MAKRLLTVVLALLIAGVAAFAQSTLSGKVTDEAGEPIIGVDVLIKGTTTGSMTDLDGVWKIDNVKPDAVIVFSCIGYKTQEVSVGSRQQIDITMKSDTEYLNDVVVIGYGTARRKDVSGAIASVNYGNDKNLNSLPNPNALAGLASRVAGFRYAPTSSASGDNTSSMTIRGKNAIPLNGGTSAADQSVNRPLLVVDGVLSYGSINEINTSDIQSIDVLKDASAAAIYGSRAANGVIIITTKKGISTKPVVSFNTSISLSDWTRMPKMVTDDETFLKNRFYTKKALDSAYSDREWNDFADLKAAASELMNSVESRAFDENVKTNWLKEISRIGVGQKYDLSISGRASNVSYYVSGDYTRQQGIRLGDDYEKYNILTKLDINVTDWLTFGIKGNYLNSNSWGQPARIQNATWMSPYSYVHALQEGYENWYNSHPDGNVLSPLWGSGAGNSYLWTDRTGKGSNINGVTYAQIDFPFLQGLSYRITLQGQRNNSSQDVFSHPEIWVSTNNTDDMDNPAKYASKAAGKTSARKNSYWNIDNILTYNKNFGSHHIDAMAGYTREHTNEEYLGIDFTGFDCPTFLGVYKIDASYPKNLVPSRTRIESSAIGYLARLNYNFDNRYYATFNFRRDGYSAFSEGHKWGNFYGASTAWVLSNEKFMQNWGAFDLLKLRLSWGQNGSRSVVPYQTLMTVSSKVSNSGSMTHTWLGDESAYGMAPQGIPNKGLTWATIEKYNLGIDFSTLKGRLAGTVDIYAGKTSNMIVTRSAPYMTGFKTIFDNVGLVTNKGVEIELNSVNINGDGNDSFRWETNLVFDSNANCIKELYGKNYAGEDVADVANALAYGFDSYYALQPGHPIGSAYDYKKLGIFNSQDEIKNYVDASGNMIQPDAKPGDLKFEDTDKDGKITTKDRHFIGSPDPLFTLNLGNTLTWKNISLYFSFRWAQGDKDHFLWFDPHAFGTSMSSGAQLASVKPWTENNHSQDYPRYGYQNTYEYQYWNSRSFLKLKDLALSYSFEQKLVGKIGLSGARIYVAATDLFTITGWSGLDPETGGNIAADPSSSRFGSDATFKSVTFGINLTF